MDTSRLPDHFRPEHDFPDTLEAMIRRIIAEELAKHKKNLVADVIKELNTQIRQQNSLNFRTQR